MQGWLRLALIVQRGAWRGDTDHWGSGCLNGLTSAPTTAKLAALWGESARAHYGPGLAICYLNDSQIVSLRVDVLQDDRTGPTGHWYALAVSTLDEPPEPDYWWEKLVYGRAENLRSLRR